MTTLLERLRQSPRAIHTVGRTAAEPLIADRLAREVTIDPPAPRGKVALRLTVLGRGDAPPVADDAPGEMEQSTDE